MSLSIICTHILIGRACPVCLVRSPLKEASCSDCQALVLFEAL